MELYVCKKTQTVVEKITDTQSELVCQGQPMEKLEANTTEAATKKHLPEVNYKDGKLYVSVGEVTHPMLSEHYIAFVMVKTSQQVLRQDLKPDEKPEALFYLGDYHGPVEVYEYCNLHGLWKKETNV